MSDRGEDNGKNKRGNGADAPFVLRSLSEIGSWATYLGGLEFMELAEPIKDKNDKVLVQRGVTLRPSIFENLQGRDPSVLPGAYYIRYNKIITERLKKLITGKLFQCLASENYHIAPMLLSKASLNLKAIARRILDNRKVLDFFMDLDRQQDPILPHLGEVALCSGAFADLICQRAKIAEGKAEIVRIALSAGLFHDIALVDDPDFLIHDIEKDKESGHEAAGSRILKDKFPDRYEDIGPLVAKHHRDAARYSGRADASIDDHQIPLEALTFTEFFFARVRSAYYSRDRSPAKDPIEQIFFLIGQVVGNGYFHPHIYFILGNLQSKFKGILRYGQQIGAVEKKCLYGESAVAYPIPLCSQILCRKNITDCEYYLSHNEISVIKPTKFIQSAKSKLPKGNYAKCRLGAELPKPPAGLV